MHGEEVSAERVAARALCLRQLRPRAPACAFLAVGQDSRKYSPSLGPDVPRGGVVLAVFELINNSIIFFRLETVNK